MNIDYKKHTKTIASKLGKSALWSVKKTGRIALLGLSKAPATLVGTYNASYNGILNLGNSI